MSRETVTNFSPRLYRMIRNYYYSLYWCENFRRKSYFNVVLNFALNFALNWAFNFVHNFALALNDPVHVNCKQRSGPETRILAHTHERTNGIALAR